MIKIPYEQIVERIKTNANISEDEIKERVNAKMKQLSGLISKEGAAHIVANELGIKLFDSFTGKLQIKNIISGLRSVETIGKVIQTYELREFNTNERQGKVASMLIGDETGNIRAVMWGNQADNIKSIKPGAIVRIVNAYVRENNGYTEIHLNDKSQLIINPKNETVEIKQKISERKSINQLNENDSSAEILGTVVQVFDPKFFEICPECSKRLKIENDVFLCQEHSKVIPEYSYVMNLILDDGTENIRTVFFRDSMEKLLKINREQVMDYKKNPEKFEDVKTELLGSILKLNGRTKKNIFFDRLEFIANDVTLNPNPEDEIKRLDEEINKAKSN